MTFLQRKVFEMQTGPVGDRNAEELEDFGFKRNDTVILHHTGQVVKWNRMASIVMNLPNDYYWNCLLIASSLVNFFVGTICFFFARDYLLDFIPIYVICDLIYLFDVIILSLHLFWKDLKKRTYIVHVHVPMFLYILDVISLLPQELVALAIFGSSSVVTVYLRWISYIRLKHLVYFIQSLSQVQKNRWRTFTIAFFTCMCVVQHLSTCLIYDASCHHLRCLEGNSLDGFTGSWDVPQETISTPEDNENITELTKGGKLSRRDGIGVFWYEGRWSERIITHYRYYEEAGTLDWYFLSFYVILEMILSLGSGIIQASNTTETVFMTVMMILGYIFFDVWFLSFYFHMTTMVRWNRANYLFKIESIKRYLRSINVSKEVLSKMDVYFDILWQKKDGIKTAPHFETLPPPLQMEIMYDINGVHLNRSLLLFDLKEFYLRTLSLYMRHEFLLPGDILFYQGVVKTSLVVIIKGVLEILSDEDDESPIIAFQAGTVLGEACLFLSLPSKATVRAAVYTEVKLVSRLDFMRIMSNYPIALSCLRQRILKRIKYTRKNTQPNIDEAEDLELDEQKALIPIKVFKDRLFERQKKAAQQKDKYRSSSSFIDTTASSKFLNNIMALYQVSNQDSNIETPVLCMTYSFPWVLDSTSSLARHIGHFVRIVHLMFLTAFAYEIVFVREISKFVHGLRLFSDVACIIDVFLVICTSVVLKDTVLQTFKEILRYRLKSLDFYLNAITLFPFEYLMLSQDQMEIGRYNRLYELLIGLKIIRLRRCYTGLREIETFYCKNNTVAFRMACCVIYFCGMTYFSGCILYLWSCLNEVCDADSWFFRIMLRAVENKEEDPCYLYPLATSLYLSANIWMHLGLGDIDVVLPGDIYIWSIYTLVGLMAITNMMSSVAATLYTINAHAELFQQEVFSFQRFLEHYKVPMEMQLQVKRVFALRWSNDRARGKIQFRKMAPSYLQMVVFKTDLMNFLDTIPLFQMIDVDFLMHIISTSRTGILPEGATICYAGDVDREMFIVQMGCCAMFDFRGDFIKYIQAGEYFGDIEMLFNMSKCSTVRTRTTCKLVQVTFRSLMSAMSMFPGEMAVIHKVLKSREFVKETEAIELKKMLSFKENVEVKQTKKKAGVAVYHKIRRLFRTYKSSFFFAPNCYKRSGGRERYWDAFRTMGKWQVLGIFLMPVTIHPESLFLKFWLVLRFIFLVAMGGCFPLVIGLPPSGTAELVIMSLAEYSAYIEIYIFLHISYYNEAGLLVTHPKLTARHYFTHGFFLDVVAALPYHAIMPWLSDDHDNLDPTIRHLVNHKMFCTWRALAILQFHRVIGFIYYLHADPLRKHTVISFLIILPMLLLTLLVGTTVVIRECRYTFFTEEVEAYKDFSTIVLSDPEDGQIYHGYFLCRKGSWVNYITHHEGSKIGDIIILAFYWFLNVFTQVGMGDVTPNNDFGMYSTILIAFIGMNLFAYILAFLNGLTEGSSALAIGYQQKIQELLNFLHKEGVADAKINKIFLYFEYVSKRTAGMEKKEMLLDMYSALKGDISLYLYEKTLRETTLFSRIARPYLRVISKNLTEEYFLKSDILIKCYDVHNTIYIILRGSVTVLTPYDDEVTKIGSGGMFGNIHQGAPACSSSTFIADRNVDVLKISSNLFFRIAQEYPAVKEVLEKVLKNVGDYILPKQNISAEVSSSDVYDESSYAEVGILTNIHPTDDPEKQSLPSINTPSKISIPKNKCLVCLLFLKPTNWFKFALEPGHIIFQYVWYTTFLATCYQMYFIPYMFASQHFNPYIFYTILCLEPVFYIRIFFFMHEAYLDHYGTYVKKFRFIARNYFKDYRRVCWDLIPNIPFYLFCFIAEPKNRLFVFTASRLFHLLRWRYIFEAFRVWSAPLMAKRAPILIAKMIVVFLLMVHYFSLVAFVIFSDWGDFSKSTRKYFREGSRIKSYIICLYFVSSILSTTGVGDIIPEKDVELAFTIIVLICTKIAFSILIVSFLMGMKILSQHIMNYEHKVIRMKKYLQNQGLSDYLMEKLWIYIYQIWNRENGLHMPELLENAPYVMKGEIMREIFSVHLREGYLFKDINEALLTQICGHLKRVVFFKGNYIVQNGDTNASMYWIHRGQVSVLTVHPNLTETRHETLNVHAMFGLAQGLNYGLSHKYSYRAETQCDILVLKLETWECVLQHFPEDKEIIYKRMKNCYTIL